MKKKNHRPSETTATSDGRTPPPAVPQNVLDLIHGALLPYPVQWGRVLTAILSSEDCNELKAVSVEEDRFLSTEELGEYLHVSRSTIFRYMKAGKIHAHKLGRRNLFSLREVVAALKNEEVPNA